MAKTEPTEDQGVLPNIALPIEKRSFEKTPMFSAINWQRYVRQALIEEIEKGGVDRGSPSILICYVGDQTQIERDDILGFVELLHNIPDGSAVDLMLHTSGGDVDAAEKLIGLVRKKVGDNAPLRVIVPDSAKSAGTLMALGANRIVMSDCSELGPIDPQIMLCDPNGNSARHSVLNYLRAYKQAGIDLANHPDNPTAQETFARFDPVLAKKFESIERRTRNVAENLLKRHGTAYTKIAAELMNIDQLPSHGQMITWEMAQDMGLEVEFLGMDDPLWRQYWSLYCHLRLAIKPGQRIFESALVSLPM